MAQGFSFFAQLRASALRHYQRRGESKRLANVSIHAPSAFRLCSSASGSGNAHLTLYDEMIGHLRQTLARLLDTLAPRSCPGCDEIGITTPLCATCLPRLELHSPARLREARVNGVPVISLGAFAPPLSTALKRLKYEGRTDLASALAELYWRHRRTACLEVFGPRAILVPVPLHPARLVERGYNQSMLLARALGQLSGYRCQPLGLRRVRMSTAQATLDRKGRMVNVRDAFKAGNHVARYPVVLVDDVVTTGATVTACMHAAAKTSLRVAGVVALSYSDARGPG